MQNELIVLDTDRTFRRILAVALSFYVGLVILIHLKGPSLHTKAAPAPTEDPPRVARLLVEPQKPPPLQAPPPRVEAPKAAPSIADAPKVENPAPPPSVPKNAPKGERAASHPAAPKASPQEQVKNVGLLGLLGGSKGPAPHVGKGFSSLKEMPPLSAGKKPASSAPGSASSLPSFAQEEIEKIRRRALTEQEATLTQTRRSVVQADLSQTKITQEGGTGGGGGRSEEAISGIVQQNREKLQLLYNRQLQRKPGLQGFLTVEFLISARGQVVECHIVASSLSDPIFEKEVVQEILRWTFPSAAQGSTTVLYPLSFLPSG